MQTMGDTCDHLLYSKQTGEVMAEDNLLSEFHSDCTYGTKYYYAESDWLVGLSDAEIQAEERFDLERDRLLDEIFSNEGFVVSENIGGTVVDTSLNSDNETIFKVSRSGEIEFGVCDRFEVDNHKRRLDRFTKSLVSSNADYYSADDRLLGLIQKRHPTRSVMVDDALTFNTYSFSGIQTLSAVRGEVDAKAPVPHPIPEKVSIENWEVSNCQQTPQTRKKDFRYEETTGQKIVFGKKSTTRRGLKASISFKGFGASGSIDRSIELNQTSGLPH